MRKLIAKILIIMLLANFMVPMNTCIVEATGLSAYLSPSSVVAGSDGNLYIADETGYKITVFRMSDETALRTIDLPGSPGGVAISSDATTLYVTDMSPSGKVYVINVATDTIINTINVGHTPVSPVLSADGSMLYVCNRFSNSVSAIILSTSTVTNIPVLREPFAAAIAGDYLYVANQLPTGAATADVVSAAVTVINTTTNSVSNNIQLPNGSTSLRGICASTDGNNIFVTHVLGRYGYPTTQLDRGWVNTNTLSIINTSSRTLNNTVLLDDVDMGAANPWAVRCTSDKIIVSHAGSQEISIIDRAGLLAKLQQVASGQLITDTLESSDDVPNDISFLGSLRNRVKLLGNGPRAIAVVGSNVYAAEYFTDSLGIVDMVNNTARTVPIGPVVPVDTIRRGEMFWNNAVQCYQQWESCVSCHPDGRADALNWDNLNDGIGTSKQTKSMLFSHVTAPSMITGTRANAELAVSKGMALIQFNKPDSADVVAVNEYLKSLNPVPSPYLENGQLSASAANGKTIFEGSAGCATCHPAATYFTDMQLHKVGTNAGNEQRNFDTPTLEEVWRTAPYLYDGRAATMLEVLTTYNINDQHGVTSNLTSQQLTDLENYVMSIGENSAYVPPSSSFSDNFDDGNADGWTNYEGTWAVTGNKYTVGANVGAKAIADDTNFGDFTFEGDVTVGTEGNAGFLFRVSNPSVGSNAYQGYYAGISTTGVEMGKTNNNWMSLGTATMSITANQVYHMKVTAIGSSIKVYVEDMATPKLDITNTSYAAGAVGVRTYNADASFDNISVLQYVAPPSTPEGLTATVIDSSTINLNWSAVTGSTGYNIYRSLISDGTYAKINSSDIIGTTYSDVDLSTATAYYYKVSAVNSGGESSHSAVVAATIPLPISTNFSDNFDDGNSDGWTTYGGIWLDVDSKYTVGANAGAKAMADDTNFGDFIYEGDVTVGASGNAGLIFRVSNPGIGPDAYQGYYAGISTSGNVELGRANNNWASLGTAAMTINANQAYHMKIVAIGSNLQVYVEDMTTPKINVTDTSFTTGSIGARTYNADAKFDNINVKKLVFRDNFDDGNANDWTTYGGTWSVSGGQYNVTADPGAKSIAVDTSFSDFTYEGNVTVSNAGNAGFVFRVSNPGVGADTYQGYYVGISSAGNVELGKGNNSWTSLGNTPMTINANLAYHMKVVAIGSNIKIYVGDMITPKINVTDTSYTTGLIGVRTYNAAAIFDNLTVN